MHPEAPPFDKSPAGLPPVQPVPTASHLVKQFLVPLLIVGGLLGLFMLACWLAGYTVLRPAESLVTDLRSSNPDVRNRAAHDLAQRLMRDDRLASEPGFGLDLVGEMPRALADADRDQAEPGKTAEAVSLEASDNYLFYLSACLSHLSTPVGVPLLKQMALDGGPGTTQVQAVRRWRALWALANLGDNLKRFDRLSPERRQEVVAGFEAEAAGTGDRAAWAAAALAYLRDRQAGKANALGVDETLVRCAKDANPFLREVAVFAMRYWQGDGAANARLEEALLARRDDRGEGEDLLDGFYAGSKADQVQFTTSPGARIRYNAAIVLAKRGSAKAPLDVLKEMLDESEQLAQNRVRYRKDGREAADEATAHDFVQEALRAVAELHRNPRVNLADLQTSIEKLRGSSNPGVRAEAERTLQALGERGASAP
jgi:hypothetical protein